MGTNFPTSIDSFTNPTATNPQNAPSHSAQHINVNAAVEAVETAIGTTGAPVLDSITARVTAVAAEIARAEAAEALLVPLAQKGAASGVAALSATGSVLSAPPGDGTNTALGTGTLASAVTGTQHTVAVGYTTFAALAIVGGNNTGVGAYAGAALIDGGGVTLVGAQAGQQLTHGQDDTFIGSIAGNAITGTLGTTSQNVVIGSTACGAALALQSCVVIGAGAMVSGIAPGPGNTAGGANALAVISGDAGSNTVWGFYGGAALSTGAYNTLIGAQSGYSGNALTTGSVNTFVGNQAGLSSATQTNRSSALGASAVVGGDYALALGAAASAGASGSVAIGTDSGGAGAASTTANLIVIGTANHTTRIPGTPAFVTGDHYLVVDSSGNIHKSALGPLS